MGSDSASSTQSKHAGSGETACLGSCWGELDEWDVGDGLGASMGVDSIVSDVAGV